MILGKDEFSVCENCDAEFQPEYLDQVLCEDCLDVEDSDDDEDYLDD